MIAIKISSIFVVLTFLSSKSLQSDSSSEEEDKDNVPQASGLNPEAAVFMPKSLQPLQSHLPKSSQLQLRCETPANIPGSSRPSARAQISNAVNSLYYFPPNPPTYINGQWPPNWDPSYANRLYVYEFEAQGNLTSQEKHHIVRLPYAYETSKPFDCLVQTQGTRERQIQFCTLFPGSNSQRRINITNVTVNGESRKFMQLSFRDPRTGDEYFSKNLLVTTHQEEDGGLMGNYGYYTVSSNSPIPLNAYKPLVYTRVFAPVSVRFPKENKFVLSLNWLPGVCIHLVWKRIWIREELCNQLRFIIHGLFGKNMYKIYDQAFSLLNTESVNVPKIEYYWPTLSRHFPNIVHWSKEWLKHGLALNFANAKDYFWTGIHLIDRPGIIKDLEKVANMSNDFEEHILDTLKQEIKKVFPRTVAYGCSSLSKNLLVLYEIRFCIENTASGWIYVNCNAADDRCIHFKNMVNTIRMMFPRTFHTFRYLTFTVFWVPTQIARMSAMKNDAHELQYVTYESVPEWKIHGLCPTIQLYWISFNYRQDVFYLGHNRTWLNNFGHIFTPQLETEWPSLVSTIDPRKRWYNWYLQCGIYARTRNIPKLRGTVNYFNFALQEKARINTENWNFPLDTELTQDEILSEIRSKVGKTVALICYRVKSNYLLVKVRVCYDNDPNMTLIDCPRTATIFRRHKAIKDDYTLANDTRNCGNKIIIPSFVEPDVE